MAIRIETIAAKNLGPLKEFSEDLAGINLIYGPNEVGKTFLVELILRTLFDNKKGFLLRDFSGSGQISVSGLTDDIEEFTTSGSKKIEDFLTEQSGFPPNVANLLVVKGAQVAFEARGPEGISESFIKNLLSGKTLADEVLEKITKTVQDSVIEDGRAIGPRRGLIRTRDELAEDLSQLNSLIATADNEFAFAEATEIERALKETTELIGELYLAKRHQAYKLNQHREEKNTRLDELKEKGLDELDKVVNEYFSNQETVKWHVQTSKEIHDDSENYLWLDEAVNNLERMTLEFRLEGNTDYPNKWVAIIGLLLFSIPVFYSFLAGEVPGTAGLILQLFSLGLLSYALYKYIAYREILEERIKSLGIASEIEELKESIKSWFEIEYTDIATLKQLRDSFQKNHFRYEELQGNIERLRDQGKNTEIHINHLFSRFQSRKVAKRSWKKKLDAFLAERTSLQSEISSLEGELRGLEIKKDDYIEEKPSKNYSKLSIEKAKTDLDNLKTRQSSLENNITGLKQNMLGVLRAKPDLSFEEVFSLLRNRVLEVSAELGHVESELVAQVLMTKIVGEAISKESDRAQQILQTKEVQQPLFDITGKYKKVIFDQGRFYVSDGVENYEFSSLSTGAKEQLFTALRLGFASRVFSKSPGFLIFDDAFQHSDWSRRPKLIKQLLNIHKAGWQIIYFSMDDNIKSVFKEQMEKQIGKDFKAITLKPY